MPIPVWAQAVSFSTSSLTINGKVYSIEVATTEQQLETGLMYRTEMAPDHGMLFIFAEPQIVRMWMKNTPLPLDMLFIDEKGKIVSIAANNKPESEYIINSMSRAKATLELLGGTCEKQHIHVGDMVHHAVFANAHP